MRKSIPRWIVVLSLLNSINSMAQMMPFGFYKDKDICLTAAPPPGTVCKSGAIFAGVFDGAKYMVTPGNCTDSTTPTCDGGTDSVTKTWRGSGGGNSDIPGITNIVIGESLSTTERGDVITPIIVAHSSTTSSSAAAFCHNMVYAGYDDWFLPSSNEGLFIYCHTNAAGHTPSYPSGDPDCVRHGGKSNELTGFNDGTRYWGTEEASGSLAVALSFDDGTGFFHLKSSSRYVRCMRRYHVQFIDSEPDAIAWADFSGSSTTETLSGFDETIFLQIEATNGTGSPNLQFNNNGLGWEDFDAGDERIVPVRAGFTFRFRVTGTSGHSATITVKNATKESTMPVLDTVVGTVP